MKWSFETVSEKINGLSLRERIILSLTVLIVLVILVVELLWAGWLAELDKTEQQITRQRNEIAVILPQLEKLQRNAQEDPNAPLRARKAQLERELKLQRERLQARLQRLVQPDEMVELLRQVLTRHKGLQVVRMENLPVTQVYQTQDGEDDVAVGNLFSHRVKMVLQGDYFSTLSYVRHLESLGQRLIFKRMDYKVGDYPTATVTLEVETLGLQEEWLGV